MWHYYTLQNLRIIYSYLELSGDPGCEMAQTGVGQQDPWAHWWALGFGSFGCGFVKVQAARDRGDCEKGDGYSWGLGGYCLQ